MFLLILPQQSCVSWCVNSSVIINDNFVVLEEIYCSLWSSNSNLVSSYVNSSVIINDILICCVNAYALSDGRYVHVSIVPSVNNMTLQQWLIM